MDWTTLLATVIGAVIALSSALFVEHQKGGRERAAEWRATRRELYSAYLAAISTARNELIALLLDRDSPLTERSRAARAAVSTCYGPRYELEILSPKSVASPAVTLFRCLRALRNAVAEGVVVGTPEADRITMAYDDALDAAREAMRQDMEQHAGP
ncbi:hypothetical protein ABZV77_09925 [Streptomyces sp. NPDC004732]|uniref:hypothetical protein n=1 Tax=Streptomyces sp. NPDC004732 TaxID=3154290 RepID=UPI0033B734E9